MRANMSQSGASDGFAVNLAKAGQLLGETGAVFSKLAKDVGALGAQAVLSAAGVKAAEAGAAPEEEKKTTEDTSEKPGDATKEMVKAIEGIKINILDLVASIDDAFRKLGKSILDIVLKPVNDAASAIVSSLAKSLLSPFFPGLAGGGRLQPGRPTLVGERGPEMVIATRPATVVNASDTRSLGGGGVTVQQTLNFDLVPAPTIGAMIDNAMPAIVEASKMAVLSSLRRGA